MNIRAWAAGLVLVLLTACGGGGGGGGDSGSQLSASASPGSAVLTASTTGGLPSERLMVILAGRLTDSVSIVVVGSAKGYVTGLIDATGTLVIFGKDPGLMPTGTYTDTLSVNVCYDDQCQRPAIASPLKIPVTYTVTQGDPSMAVAKILDTVPDSAPVGSADFELTIDGTNFAPSSTVIWNDHVLASTYVSSNRLTVMVPASELGSVATATIEVSNTGAEASAGYSFQIRGPVPTVSSLMPATAARGGSAFLLTITGSGFDSTSHVTWNGSGRPTAYISPTRVTAQIYADDIAAGGASPVGVYNVDGGSITSNTVALTVADAPLSVGSLVPTFVTAGGPAYAQTVMGTGFDTSSTLQFNGSPRTTTFVSTTQIVAQLSAADVAGIGSAAITVANGGGNPATSGPLTLTIGAASTDATAVRINPHHDGAIRFASILAPTALSTSPAWTANLDGPSGYPLIAGGRVFATVSAPGSGQLVALSAATGAVLWGPVRLPWPVSGATYDNGRVIAVSEAGQMSAFDAATGTLLWSTLLTGQWYYSAPTAVNGIVFVGGYGFGSDLYAFNDATGAMMWALDDDNGGVPTVTADGVYVSSPCHTSDYQPATGAMLWHHDGDCNGGGSGAGAYANGVYYSPDGENFDAETGSMLPDVKDTPALGSSIGYFVRWAGTLEAVDLASRTSRWTFAGDGKLVSLPTLVNDYVFVQSNSGHLYALDAFTGTQLWSTSLGPAFDSYMTPSPMAAGNGLLLVPVGKTLVAYTLSNNP